jgi:quinol monooxygenase YgiN
MNTTLALRLRTKPVRRFFTFLAVLLGALTFATASEPKERGGNRASQRPSPSSAEATICVDFTMVTLVTTFSCGPDDQQKLIDLLLDGTRNIMVKQPGFISSTVLRCEGGKVINYSQWRSRDAIARMRQQPEAHAYFEKVSAVSRFESAICDVEHVTAAE